jgi:hypothetical protein
MLEADRFMARAEGRSADVDAINRQILALERLKQATRDKFVKGEGDTAARDRDQALQAGRDAANQIAVDGARAAAELERALTDSLFRAAEAGKDSFSSLRDSIAGMFNNLVLRPIVMAAISPISAALQGVAGAGAGSSGLSGLGSFGNLGSSAAGLANSFSYSSIGQSLGLSTIAPEAAMYSAATGAGGAALTGAGSALGAVASAMPYLAAAVALYSMFAKDGGGPKGGRQFQHHRRTPVHPGRLGP